MPYELSKICQGFRSVVSHCLVLRKQWLLSLFMKHLLGMYLALKLSNDKFPSLLLLSFPLLVRLCCPPQVHRKNSSAAGFANLGTVPFGAGYVVFCVQGFPGTVGCLEASLVSTD